MAEGRILLKKTSLSEDLADLTNDTHRMLYTWAIPHLDIEGRMEGSARKFKAAVCPLLEHITVKIIEDFLEEISEKHLVVIYEVEGKKVLWFPKFKKHQPPLRPDKEARSKFPPPPAHLVPKDCPPDTENTCPNGWEKTKKFVFERDDYTCKYCGQKTDAPHCDHVVPISRGGRHSLDNLVTACPECNLSKHAKTPEEWLQ